MTRSTNPFNSGASVAAIIQSRLAFPLVRHGAAQSALRSWDDSWSSPGGSSAEDAGGGCNGPHLSQRVRDRRHPLTRLTW